MSNIKEDYIRKLSQIIEIGRLIIEKSKYLDVKSKKAFVNSGDEYLKIINEKYCTLTQLKSISKMFLPFWNEAIGVDIELFWIELKNHNLDFERKDELIFALAKNRFRRVDQGFSARNNWEEMKDMKSLKDRFLDSEIEQIGKIIEVDESKRVKILKKCLEKKQIPQSQYLKFGECWAYLSYCNLLEKYFDQEQKDELSDIHRNFKSV
ncbi:hypothetical protein BD847_2624 [Flavobacterium cutihirudinis]|uniref:Uncharacterized protein n=1 Tax=Flavobacterium cutihirudinis TaxID=1265740 RepID=A0A3D9FUD1_9FLAO|nr:hypothetical protein [Flavobacterium cutihirudinis]RED23564.1 hypothetical protein BD847_2624 [Flavobacterium cutihirudinis]